MYLHCIILCRNFSNMCLTSCESVYTMRGLSILPKTDIHCMYFPGVYSPNGPPWEKIKERKQLKTRACYLKFYFFMFWTNANKMSNHDSLSIQQCSIIKLHCGYYTCILVLFSTSDHIKSMGTFNYLKQVYRNTSAKSFKSM